MPTVEGRTEMLSDFRTARLHSPVWHRIASMRIAPDRHYRTSTAASKVATIPLLFALSVAGFALERPGVEYKIFQFPADKIPRIDGDPSDWSIVPETYSIGIDQLKETSKGRGFNYDRTDLDVKVKVGWVKGL